MKLFLMGAAPSFDVANCNTVTERLAMTGGNTGNQLIAHGLIQPLIYEHIEWDFHKGPNYINNNFDVIVVAAANFLFPGFDMGGIADFIEQTKLPVVVVGLGAQSKDYSPKIQLQPGTMRLVRVMAERAKIIGVRGPFTASVLAEYGVHNVQVTGCPSYYMGGEKSPLLAKKPWPVLPRLAINGSRDVLDHAFDRDRMYNAVSGLVTEAIRYDGAFIAQTEFPEIALAEGGDSPETEKALNELAAFYAEAIPDSVALRAWAIRQMRVYWSMDTWLQDMKALDFVVGTRFHGALAAINMGTPGFMLCHDTRTTEMCEFLGIPHADIREIDKIDVEELYSRVDVHAFVKRRAELLPAYAEFLDANGLKHRTLGAVEMPASAGASS